SAETELAVEVGERALTYNPNNLQLRDTLALALYANSRWDEALNLVALKSGENNTAEHRRLLMLEAFRHRDWDSALKQAEQLPSESEHKEIYRIAALAGSRPEISDISQEMQAQLIEA